MLFLAWGQRASLTRRIQFWVSVSEEPDSTRHCVLPSIENAKWWDLWRKNENSGQEWNQSHLVHT